MSDSRPAYRYALAVIGVAEESKQLDRVSDDLTLLSNAVDGSREFFLFLKSPNVSKEQKKKLLNAVFQDKISPLTMKFLHLVTDKGRETILSEIIRQFNLLRDIRRGVINVTLKTATSMASDQQKILTDRLQNVTKKKVRLTEFVDKALIGGFTVQYEDTVWDGSVRRQLELLRRQLMGNAAL